jgi:hypothetical protein
MLLRGLKTPARGFLEQWKVRLYIGMLDQFPASLPSNQHDDRMLRLKAVLFRTPNLAPVVFIGLLCAQSDVANADGSPPASPSDTLTHFESFILTNCIPCVRELYSIATVPIPSIKAPAFSGVAPVNRATSTRAGELRFELLRAYPVGLKSREHLAMRVVLSVSAGSEGALYTLGAGLLDEDEVPVLAAALSQMSKSMSSRADDASIRLVDTEFHADSVRMGTVRTGNDVLAYVQVAPADLPRFVLKQVWELPTMYLPSRDIPTLEQSVIQVSAKIRAIRGR